MNIIDLAGLPPAMPARKIYLRYGRGGVWRLLRSGTEFVAFENYAAARIAAQAHMLKHKAYSKKEPYYVELFTYDVECRPYTLGCLGNKPFDKPRKKQDA